MTMERMAMKGRLAQAIQDRAKLCMRVDAACGSIRMGLNTALTAPADLEILRIAEEFDSLVSVWGELQAVLSEISRLEQELG